MTLILDKKYKNYKLKALKSNYVGGLTWQLVGENETLDTLHIAYGRNGYRKKDLTIKYK